MKELKLVNAQKCKPQSHQSPEPTHDVPASSASASRPAAPPYEPKIAEIPLYMSEEDVKTIETIIDSYWKAYRYSSFDL